MLGSSSCNGDSGEVSGQQQHGGVDGPLPLHDLDLHLPLPSHSLGAEGFPPLGTGGASPLDGWGGDGQQGHDLPLPAGSAEQLDGLTRNFSLSDFNFEVQEGGGVQEEEEEGHGHELRGGGDLPLLGSTEDQLGVMSRSFSPSDLARVSD